MSGPSFHHATLEDESDCTSSPMSVRHSIKLLLTLIIQFSIGTEFDWFHRGFEQTDLFQPVHAPDHTASSAGNPSTALLDDILPWNNFDTPIQTSALTARLNSFPSLPPPTFPSVPTALDARGSHSAHGHYPSSGMDSLFPQCGPHTAPMTGHPQYGGEWVSAHDRSLCGINDYYSTDYPCQIPSPAIATPIATGPAFSVRNSHYVKPAFHSGPALLMHSDHPTSPFLNPPSFNPAPSMIPCKGINTESCPSPSLSFSSPTSPHPTTTPKQIYPQSNMTVSSDQFYTITVPLEAIEFPPSFTEKTQFLRCHWEDCGVWIVSEGRAIKDHIVSVHKVLKREDGSYHCEWVDCPKSGEWSGLVRHIQKHLRLRWLCSVCEKSFPRRDCVRGHANKVPRCKAAHPVSYPSKLAYKARNNGDSMVTLTKMLQPKKAT